MEMIAIMPILARMVSACVVDLKHIVFKIAPVPIVNKLLDQESLRLHLRRIIPRLKGRLQMPQISRGPASSENKNKGRGRSKGKDKKNKPSAKTGNFEDADNDVQEGEDNQKWG